MDMHIHPLGSSVIKVLKRSMVSLPHTFTSWKWLFINLSKNKKKHRKQRGEKKTEGTLDRYHSCNLHETSSRKKNSKGRAQYRSVLFTAGQRGRDGTKFQMTRTEKFWKEMEREEWEQSKDGPFEASRVEHDVPRGRSLWPGNGVPRRMGNVTRGLLGATESPSWKKY